MKSVVEDNLEAAIDIFSKSISGDKLTDQQLDVLTNIPIVKNITAIARFYGSIREASTVKKIVKFIETLQKGHLDKETGLGNPGSSFISSGLAYLYYNDDVPPRIARNGHFYNDFWDYGLKPYQEEVSNE